MKHRRSAAGDSGCLGGQWRFVWLCVIILLPAPCLTPCPLYLKPDFWLYLVSCLVPDFVPGLALDIGEDIGEGSSLLQFTCHADWLYSVAGGHPVYWSEHNDVPPARMRICRRRDWFALWKSPRGMGPLRENHRDQRVPLQGSQKGGGGANPPSQGGLAPAGDATH